MHIVLSSLPKIADLGRPVVQNAKTILGLSCQKVRDQIFKACPAQTSWKPTSEQAAKIAELDTFFSWDNLPHKLAMDCFHHNKEGQAEISELFWNAQPWYK